MMLSRPNAGVDRTFPLPSELVGDCSSPWFAAATSPLRWNPTFSISGLLWLHRAAILSEAQGAWQRAEFYWREVDAHYLKLSKKPGGLGSELLTEGKKLGAPLPADSKEVSGRFVDEILIDSHLAFYNSLIEEPEAGAKARSSYHLGRLKAKLPDSGMTPAERGALLRPLVNAAVQAAEGAGRWRDVARQYRELLEVNSDDQKAQDGLVRALWEEAVSVLGTDRSEASARREALALQKVVDEMEYCGKRLTFHAEFYDVLGRTHLMHAVRLANSSQLSDALVAVEKALAVRPGWDEAEDTRKQLKEMMVSLQTQFQALEAQIRRTPNASLNSAGLEMQAQARSGIGPAERFAGSEKAKQYRIDSEHARAHRFWTRLGLAPPEGDWNEQAQLLLDVLGYIFQQAPKTRAELETEWNSVIASEPRLAALDREKPLDFLDHRLFDSDWQPVEAASLDDDSEPRPALTVPLASRVRKSSGAPFGEWIRSRQEGGLKLRIVLAAAAVLVAAGLLIHERAVLGGRQRALAAVALAVRQQNDVAVMQAAGDYLSLHPFTSDSREPDVVGAYQRSFVRWMASLDQFRPEDQGIIDRYRQLVSPKKHS